MIKMKMTPGIQIPVSSAEIAQLATRGERMWWVQQEEAMPRRREDGDARSPVLISNQWVERGVC